MALHGLWWDSTLHLRDSIDTHDDRCAEVARCEDASRPISEHPSVGCLDAPTSLNAADAVTWLAGLPSPPSRSLRYWSVLARFVLSLLARKQFAPDLVQRPGGTFAAMWRPVVLDPAELAWVERCAAHMPPECATVAIQPGGGETPERPSIDPSPLEIVESFLNAGIDSLVRKAAASDPFFQRLHERVRGPVPSEVRWLSALLSGDPVVEVTPEEAEELVGQVRGWVDVIDQPAPGDSFRLSFELVEPDANDGPDQPRDSEPGGSRKLWRVNLRLQSFKEPGTYYELAQVWRETGEAPSVFRRHRSTRREQLVDELARAERVFPPIRKLLDWPDQSGIDLSVWEARTFIRDWGPRLEALGSQVILPDWARRGDHRIGLRLFIRPRAAPLSSGGATTGALGLDSVVEFDWRVAVGDREVELAEFERLAKDGAPLVRHGDAWLEWEPESADQVLEFLRCRSSGEITLGEALRIAYGADELETRFPILGLSGASWVDTFLRGAPDGRVTALRQPAAFKGTLRPYQRRGLDWLVFLDSCGIGACLADDMGLGKTVQLIALLLHEREAGRGAEGGSEPSSPPLPLFPSPTLLFAPASVVGNWERELQRFAPSLRVLVHHGAQRLEGEAFRGAAASHDVVITTYALGHRDFDELRQVAWHRVVLDEAQKIKNPAASQTLAIRSLSSARRVALTGTPIENHLPELWSIMEALNPGLLGPAAQFRKRFVVPIEKQADAQRAARLREMLRPFILRRVKTDPGVICDLPEKMEMRVFCNLTVEQAARYRQVVDESLAAIDASDGIRRRGLILAMLTRLKQVCDHPSLVLRDGGPADDRSGKCERLVEMLEEVLEEGDAALVFTQYRQMGHLLEEMLARRLDIETLFLHGGTPTKRRDQMIERFQDPAGGIKVFLLSLRAGGLGINLTAANHVFHFDRWWNPAVEAQATDRSHRVGQTRRVQVHKFVCIGTVEERIDKLLEEKRALAENVIRSGDEWLTGLSTSELREYIMLSQEAVG